MTAASSVSKGKGEKVLLHVYEPAEKPKISVPGFGAYHTGIELCGVEYWYGGSPDTPGTGVVKNRPKQSPDTSTWKYKETVDLGLTSRSSKEISTLLSVLESEFPARDYHMIHHNCNHFTAEVCKRLGDISFPSHINRGASLLSWFVENPNKDREAREKMRKEQEDKAKNIFANSKGHSISTSSSSFSSSNSTSVSTSITTGTTTATTTSTRKPNPW